MIKKVNIKINHIIFNLIRMELGFAQETNIVLPLLVPLLQFWVVGKFARNGTF